MFLGVTLHDEPLLVFFNAAICMILCSKHSIYPIDFISLWKIYHVPCLILLNSHQLLFHSLAPFILFFRIFKESRISKAIKSKVQDVFLACIGLCFLSLIYLINGVGSAKAFLNIGEVSGAFEYVVYGPAKKRSATYSWSTILSEGNNWMFELSFGELKFKLASSFNTTFLLIVIFSLTGLYNLSLGLCAISYKNTPWHSSSSLHRACEFTKA